MSKTQFDGYQSKMNAECPDGFEDLDMDEGEKAQAAKEEFFKDSDDDENFIVDYNASQYCNWILKMFDCLKVVCMICIICYFWIWTADNRIWEVDVLEQMCRTNLLNMTFHDDKIVQGQSWSTYNSTHNLNSHSQFKTQMERYHDGAQGHMPTDIKFKAGCNNFTNGTANYTCIIHSTNIWDASLAVARSEMGDKTFLLIIIFAVMWSPFHLGYVYVKEADPHHKQVHVHGSHMHAHLDITQFNPIKIITYTSMGQIYINVKSLWVQHSIFANEVRLIIAVILIVVLIFYMYDVVRQHLSNISKQEQKLRKDDDEKYSCSKDYVLELAQERIEHQNSMKKKQMKLAENHEITDYIRAPKKSSENNEYKNHETLVKESLKAFITYDPEEQKKRENEEVHHRNIQKKAKLEWKIMKYEQIENIKEKVAQKEQQKIEKEKRRLTNQIKRKLLGDEQAQEGAEGETKAPKDMLAGLALISKNLSQIQTSKIEGPETARSMAFEPNESKIQEFSPVNSHDGEKDNEEDENQDLLDNQEEKPTEKLTGQNLFKSAFKSKLENKLDPKIVAQIKEEVEQEMQKNEQAKSKLLGVKKITTKIYELVKKFLFDIIFLIFMASQEVDDTSFLKQFQYRSRFEIHTLVYSVVIAHISMNIIVVTTAFIFTSLFVTQNQAGAFGVGTMYFICVYEFSFHILNWTATYLELGYIV